VGGRPARHGATLRYLKAHLVPEGEGAAIVDGAQRMSIHLEGPPLQVVSLVVDARRGEVRAVVDDGLEELVKDDAIGMSKETGRFEFAARAGTVRALLSRSAHETLLAHAGEDAGAFHISAGERRISIRT
jgi:hypothetical protein